MKYRVIGLSILLLISCKKKVGLPIEVIGHAGNGLEFTGSVFHGNSKEAMDLTISNPKSDGVEMDVRMASDGTLWLSHDETLDGETKSSGCVGDKNSEDLAGIRYKSLNNEKLAKLDQIESFFFGEKLLFLDIKHLNACENSIQDVSLFLAALADWKNKIKSPENRIFIVLNNSEWIEAFVLEGWNVLFSSDDNTLRNKLLMIYPQLKGFVCKNKLCSKKEVEHLKNQGKDIYLYEVRSPKALKEVRDKNPSGVMSDDLQGAIIEFK